jgi:cysteine-rich repeat protein
VVRRRRRLRAGRDVGNGFEEDGEQCDDGNTAAGDGCSATCTDEVCGDGAVIAPEACDDGNAVAGDGCSATCTVEDAVFPCRAAIARGGSKYAAVRLAAVLKCRDLLAAGKTLSVDDPAQCASETGAAKRIAKAAAQARKAIADGKQPKCTDALVAPLDACAETVDGLIGTGGAPGCLLERHDAAVEDLLGRYGY